jgi:uncharacterized membrane protein YbhN (UPF0104 family)
MAWLTAAAAVAVLAALLLFGDAGQVAGALARLSPSALALAVVLVTVAYGLRFAKWHLLVRRLGIPTPPGRSLQVFLSGLMMVVTPAKLGELWKSVLLQQDGVPVSRSLPAVAVERLVDMAAIALLASAGLAVLWGQAWLVPLAAAAVLAGVAVLRWRALWGRLAGFLERRRRLAPAGRFLRTAAGGARDLLGAGTLGLALPIGLAAWTLEGLALGALLAGLGWPVPWATAVTAFCAGSLAGVLSLLPGGLGTAEAGMLGILVAEGVGHEAAVAGTLLARACTLGYGALLGAGASLLWPAAAGSAAPHDRRVVDAQRPGDALQPPLEGPQHR